MTPTQFRTARLTLGLTQRALAQKLGRTWQMISRYENGHTDVPRVVEIAIQSLKPEETHANRN